MNAFGQTICLSMIVKNEAHVIERCIKSVRPIIDHWIIVDTGSTDGTQDVIRAALADLPGRLVERPWVNFAHNRTEALKFARPNGKYTLIIDADDELIIPAGFVMPKLDAPAYIFTIHDDFSRYTRRQLVNNTMTWYYKGVLHEFLESDHIVWDRPFPLAMRRGEDGARHLDKKTARSDVDVLEKALKTETDPYLVARYTFYLAQSYRDNGEYQQALKFYLKRAELGMWDGEVYISLLSAAYLMSPTEPSEERVLSIFDRAIALCPARSEARHGAARYCREKGRYVESLDYAAAALSLPIPTDALFLQPWIYSYGVRDEYAVGAYLTGQYRNSLATCLDMLDQADLPPDVRTRIVTVSRKALAKLLDPVWGFHKSEYTSDYMPHWRAMGQEPVLAIQSPRE